jgi:hypothetical protein
MIVLKLISNREKIPLKQFFWKSFWRSFRKFAPNLVRTWKKVSQTRFLKGVLKEFQKPLTKPFRTVSWNISESFSKHLDILVQTDNEKYSETFLNTFVIFRNILWWKKPFRNVSKRTSERNSELPPILAQINNETNSETFQKRFDNYRTLQKRFWINSETFLKKLQGLMLHPVNAFLENVWEHRLTMKVSAWSRYDFWCQRFFDYNHKFLDRFKVLKSNLMCIYFLTANKADINLLSTGKLTQFAYFLMRETVRNIFILLKTCQRKVNP